MNQITNDQDKIFETPWGNVIVNVDSTAIVVRVSSGFDSAVLLYMLAKTAMEHNPTVKIYPVTVRRTNTTGFDHWDRVDNFKNALGVIDWVRKKFPSVDIKDGICFDSEHWWNCEPSSEITEGDHTYVVGQHILVRYVKSKETIFDASRSYKFVTYGGVTKNPDFELAGFNPEASRNKRIETSPTDSLDSTYAPDGSVSVMFTSEVKYGTMNIDPFRNGDKRVTFYLADTLGILDEVLAISRSCEGTKELTNSWTEECHHCWWCYERTWASETYNNAEPVDQEKYKTPAYFNSKRKNPADE